jgi:hypothetical protein
MCRAFRTFLFVSAFAIQGPIHGVLRVIDLGCPFRISLLYMTFFTWQVAITAGQSMSVASI